MALTWLIFCLLFGIACVNSNGAGAGSGFAERGRAFTLAGQARRAIKENGEESKELDRLCLTAHVTRCLGGAVCYSF